jgi:hypothetical protein
MSYDTRKPHELELAKAKFERYCKAMKVITIKEKRKKMTVSQNAYLHIIIDIFGMETGYTKAEAKTLLKRECPMMVYDRKGSKFLRSTASLSKDESQVFIEWIRNFSAAQGYYIPTSEEYLIDQYAIDNKIELYQSIN